MKIKQKKMSTFARFSTMGIQMGVTIAFFSWLGTYLDEKYKTETPWWTIGLSLFGVTTALYIVIKEVVLMSKKNEEKKI